MNQPMTSSSVLAGEQKPIRASAVATLSPEEVIPLAREELTRFLALIEVLTPAEWDRPTDCSLWTVKDIVAHQASHVLALIHFREFLDQFNPLKFRDYTQQGMNTLDAANQRQVDKRAKWTPAQIIAEIRDNSEASFIGRQRFPFLLRWVRVGTPGYEGRISIGELIDGIFTRDMWMHRVDICRATGREMMQTPDHDGRITALVVQDLDRHLSTKLKGLSLTYRLTGKAGGEWTVGGSSPAAEISLDVLEFHRLASGRINSQQALVKIDGDQALGSLALQNTVVLY
jgi:uncharacterized protein (TIGR03083 family)